jgi:transposase
LKREENLTDSQSVKLAELLRYNLKSVRSYLLREEFRRFWDYSDPFWAGKFLYEWCAAAMRCRIDRRELVARLNIVNVLRKRPGLNRPFSFRL